MQTIRKRISKQVWTRSKGYEDIALDVSLIVDDDAIIERLGARAFRNKSGSSSFMQGAVVITATRANLSD